MALAENGKLFIDCSHGWIQTPKEGEVSDKIHYANIVSMGQGDITFK